MYFSLGSPVVVLTLLVKPQAQKTAVGHWLQGVTSKPLTDKTANPPLYSAARRAKKIHRLDRAAKPVELKNQPRLTSELAAHPTGIR